MAAAQQKAKKEKGQRNPNRPNGKAWKRTESPVGGKIQVIDEVRKLYDQHQPRIEVISRQVPYKGNGVQVSGRGKAKPIGSPA
jgi:hypothetical protein